MQKILLSAEQWNDVVGLHCPVVCILLISAVSTGGLARQVTAKVLHCCRVLCQLGA
jgi:hypothetical protein